MSELTVATTPVMTERPAGPRPPTCKECGLCTRTKKVITTNNDNRDEEILLCKLETQKGTKLKSWRPCPYFTKEAEIQAILDKEGLNWKVSDLRDFSALSGECRLTWEWALRMVKAKKK